MEWDCYIWNGSKLIFVIVDRGYIIWDEFGDLRRLIGSDSKSKIVEAFETEEELERYLKTTIGKYIKVGDNNEKRRYSRD